MEIKSNHIGKVIDSKTFKVLGIFFCTMWQGKKVYITSADVVPIQNNLVKKMFSWLVPEDIMFEDAFGNIVSMQLMKSKTVAAKMGGVGSVVNIAIFEIYGEQHLEMEPLELASEVQRKTVKPNLICYAGTHTAVKKCKILCSEDIGFIQVSDTSSLNFKGAPVVSPGANKLLGFYSSANFNKGSRTLKAAKVGDVSTEDDFIYNGRITTLEVIKAVLEDVYGPDNDGSITW